MAIVALLLTIALPRYFGSLQHAKEEVLKENLQVLRETFDRFYADKGRYPASLEELVSMRYLREIPIDPITESNKTWQTKGAQLDEPGLADIQSGAPGVASDGKPYASY